LYESKKKLLRDIHKCELKDLHIFVGQILIDAYTNENPYKQSLWCPDAGRIKYVLKKCAKICKKPGKSKWTLDVGGLVVRELIIKPCVDYIIVVLEEERTVLYYQNEDFQIAGYPDNTRTIRDKNIARMEKYRDIENRLSEKIFMENLHKYIIKGFYMSPGAKGEIVKKTNEYKKTENKLNNDVDNKSNNSSDNESDDDFDKKSDNGSDDGSDDDSDKKSNKNNSNDELDDDSDNETDNKSDKKSDKKITKNDDSSDSDSSDDESDQKTIIKTPPKQPKPIKKPIKKNYSSDDDGTSSEDEYETTKKTKKKK